MTLSLVLAFAWLILSLHGVQAQSSKFTTLYAFGGMNGQIPYGDLTLDDNNNLLYGVTTQGGNSGMEPSTRTTQSQKHIPCYTASVEVMGANPNEGMTLDGSSNTLYGATYSGM